MNGPEAGVSCPGLWAVHVLEMQLNRYFLPFVIFSPNAFFGPVASWAFMLVLQGSQHLVPTNENKDL